MTQDDIIRMARGACPYTTDEMRGAFYEGFLKGTVAERNKLAAWMIQHGYATGHGDTTEALLEELDWQIAENWTNALVKGVEGEREACAKLCEEGGRDESGRIHVQAWGCAKAIRARGQK